jgi:hypothetical protein
MFYVLLTGEGGPSNGCGYTVGCNTLWKVLEAQTVDEAYREVSALIAGRIGSELAYEQATILQVSDKLDVDVQAIKDKVKADTEQAEEAEARKTRRRMLDKLKVEFNE